MVRLSIVSVLSTLCWTQRVPRAVQKLDHLKKVAAMTDQFAKTVIGFLLYFHVMITYALAFSRALRVFSASFSPARSRRLPSRYLVNNQPLRRSSSRAAGC